MESPSINFHARIIIGKLESWLPDSRFVSPNESEREGAQRRAAPSVCAASSRSSRLRAAVTRSPTCDLPVRGRRALQTRPAAEGSSGCSRFGLHDSPPSPGAGRLQTVGGCGRRGAPLWLPNSALWPPARPRSSPPTSDSCGSREHDPPPPRPCPGEAGAALCAARWGLWRPRPGELGTAVGFSFLSSRPPTPYPLKNPCCKCNQMLDTISHTLQHPGIIRSGKACFQANRPNKCYYWDSASPGCTIVTRARLIWFKQTTDCTERECGACISPPQPPCVHTSSRRPQVIIPQIEGEKTLPPNHILCAHCPAQRF